MSRMKNEGSDDEDGNNDSEDDGERDDVEDFDNIRVKLDEVSEYIEIDVEFGEEHYEDSDGDGEGENDENDD